MVILTTRADPELARALPRHTVVVWDLSEPPPPAHVALVHGLDEVAQASCRPFHLVGVLPAGVAVPARLVDFVSADAPVLERAARLERVCASPTRPVQQVHALLVQAVDSTSDIVEVSTPQSVYEYVNRAYEAVLGWAPSDAVGRTPASLVRSDVHPVEFFRDLQHTVDSGRVWSGVLVSKARAGHLVHLDTTITPIADEAGVITHHVAIKRDITADTQRRQALVEANLALERARDAALSASRTKSEFLANMSHELRTPLNAILGYSEMLLEDSDDPDVKRDLGRVHAAGHHLLGLVNDVLDISKIEAEKIELIPETVDLCALAESVAATAAALAAQGRDTFRVTCAPDLGAVRVDPRRLRQVLLNLVSNACKFTRDGEVELSIERSPGWVHFRVRDTGIGISPEHQARLFHPFVQADASTTRAYGGTGLGLAISRGLVERMGGTISLKSALGSGSTFEVALPDDAPAPSALGEGSPLVLLIDDDPTVRTLFTRMMERRGFRVALAENGPEGIALADQLVPRAIVLDVRMPGMSGWDVLTALKLSERCAHVPVIMLSATPDSELGRELGAIDHLVKPFDADVLAATLRRHTKAAGARVLVVEDDEPTRELLARNLTRMGYAVDTAEDGLRGLEALPRVRPDLVLLDLTMPVMDGFTFLDHLRADPAHSRIPVIVATARLLSADDRGRLSSAQHVVEKTGHTLREVADAVGEQIRAAIGA